MTTHLSNIWKVVAGAVLLTAALVSASITGLAASQTCPTSRHALINRARRPRIGGGWIYAAILCLFSLPAFAQFALVVGTVVDPSGFPYANGTITPQLIAPGGAQVTLSGQPYSPPGSAGLSLTGSFTMRLARTDQLTVNGSTNVTTWNFHVCSGAGSVQPAGGPGPVCFDSGGLAITAGADLSSTLSTIAPHITNTQGPSTFTIQAVNSSTGTLCNYFAKTDLTSGASSMGLLTVTTGGETVVRGVVTAGCGTNGIATLVTAGQVQLIFDAASATVGDLVGIDSSGIAQDVGTSPTGSTFGQIIAAPGTGALPSACTTAPGCWIQVQLGGTGGSGGQTNAIIQNPAATATNTATPTVSTVTPFTGICPSGAAASLPCLVIKNSSGATVLTILNNGQVVLGATANSANIGSGTASNTDFGGILTASGSTATYTFAGTYSNHPLCYAVDLTATHLAYLIPTYTGTTSVSFTTGGATDTVQYFCPYRN